MVFGREPNFMNDQFAEDDDERNERLRHKRLRKSAPYGEMCRNPDLCVGKGYCPRDPTCGD